MSESSHPTTNSQQTAPEDNGLTSADSQQAVDLTSPSAEDEGITVKNDVLILEDEGITAKGPQVPPEPQQEPAKVENPYDRRRTARSPNTDRRKTSRSAKAHLFVTVCHWSMVTLLTLNLLSGVRIGWGYLQGPFSSITTLVGPLAPAGELWGINLITFHVITAFLMLGVTGVYLVYLFGTPAWRRLRVTMKDLKHLSLMELRVNGWWRGKQAVWSANLLTYWLAFISVALLMLTGLGLYRTDLGLHHIFGGYDTARWLHAIVAYLLVPYTIVHMLLQWGFGRFWTIFKAQLYKPHIRAGLVGTAVALPVAWGSYFLDTVPLTLTAARIPIDVSAPILDGDPSDMAWRQAQPVQVHTVKSINTTEEYVDVSVRALHNGQYVYFQFQWEDREASAKRFPLYKTEHGWTILQTAKAQADENVYYEDKLAVYITDVPNRGCAATCHIGSGPHAERGDKHGLHYTDGEVGDVWHWKYVRTNPMGKFRDAPGFMDDQHFRAPDPLPAHLTGRYKAGYHADPKTDGGYNYNYEKLEAKGPNGEHLVRPLFVPRVDVRPNMDPTTSEHGIPWWIHASEGIPYDEATDTYPIGSLLPNIITEAFEGDRADVRAKGVWAAGRWTLEARRVLDTQSEYDVAFSPEKPVYLSVGVFNRTQTRHTEHIKPIQVVLER